MPLDYCVSPHHPLIHVSRPPDMACEPCELQTCAINMVYSGNQNPRTTEKDQKTLLIHLAARQRCGWGAASICQAPLHRWLRQGAPTMRGRRLYTIFHYQHKCEGRRVSPGSLGQLPMCVLSRQYCTRARRQGCARAGVSCLHEAAPRPPQSRMGTRNKRQ